MNTSKAHSASASYSDEPQAAAIAAGPWPNEYAEASRAIALEHISNPHDPSRYWAFFPGTD